MKMEKVKKSSYYYEDGIWYADKVQVNSPQRIHFIEYLGIGEKYLFRYKNKKEQYRWRFVKSIAPNKEAGFILRVHIIAGDYSPVLIDLKMAVVLGDDHIQYQWITNSNMSRSTRSLIPTSLSDMEIAYIESSLESSLGGNGDIK